MLNSTKHEIYPAHKGYMSTIVGILTFISRIKIHYQQGKSLFSVFFYFMRSWNFSPVELSIINVLQPKLIICVPFNIYLCENVEWLMSNGLEFRGTDS